MKKQIIPTPFDLGVINVVEYLSSARWHLKPGYEKYAYKNDILKAIGIAQEKWYEIRNHYRHVSTRPERQAKIVGLLKDLFRIDPNYIYHYGSYKRMFIDNILIYQVEVDQLSGMSAQELTHICRLQLTVIEQLKKKLSEMESQLEEWRRVAQAHEKRLGTMSLAADDGDMEHPSSDATADQYPAKNPATPKTYKPRKPRK